MLEGKLAGAAINASGLLRDRLKYKYEGEGNARKITAWATLKGESEPSSVTVELAKVKTTNKMWDSQPDQQLVYSANRIWGRRFAPEVMLGVNAPEEFEGPMPAAPDNFSGVTLDAKAEPPQAARTPAAETKPKAKPPGEWLDELEAALAACTTADEVHAIVSAKGVQAAFGIFKNGNLTRLEAITAAADERFRKPADPPPAMSATADIDDEIPF
jgi:hypothetical protein